MKMLKDESGQAMILTLVCMTCLLGFVGFAADIGTLLNAKRQIQTAADSAAIAGALEQTYGDTVTAGQAAAAQNGVTNGLNGGAVTINTPPQYGAYVGQTGYVEAIVSQSEPTFFMKMFNFASMTVSARAVATNGAGTDCMYLLGSSGSNIALSGSGSIDVPDCGIIADSTAGNAIALSGSGKISAQSIGVAGGTSTSGSGKITPLPITGIAPAGDPLASLAEPTVPSSCSAYSASGSNAVTLNPGCYSNLSFSGSGAVTFNPGLYILNGPLDFSGSGQITGNGVSFYVTSPAGSINLSGSQTMNLSAPTSGAYDGILFFEERGDVDPFSISGSGNMNLTGIFYMPNAALDLSGSSSETYDAAFVTSQINLSGSGSITLNDYALTNSSTPLTSATLVE